MSDSTRDCWLVIPCFNEAARLDEDELSVLVQSNHHLVLVDDGSNDSSWNTICAFARRYPDQVSTIQLSKNFGKAEAVRRGMLYALEHTPVYIGYVDADFSVTALEMNRLVEIVRADEELNVVLGSRWLRLGADIQRSALRHYASRIFATFASMLLAIPVYDTQCGAKVFRVKDQLREALDEPFVSRWAFDVELLGRLLSGDRGYAVEALFECPLNRWHEKDGSKLGLVSMLVANFELLKIYRSLSR